MNEAPHRIWLSDCYTRVICYGLILIRGTNILPIVPFGGVPLNPEEEGAIRSDDHRTFCTRASRDANGVNVVVKADSDQPREVRVTGTLVRCVKVGVTLAGNPHEPQPSFRLTATFNELEKQGGKNISIRGGADLLRCKSVLLSDDMINR